MLIEVDSSLPLRAQLDACTRQILEAAIIEHATIARAAAQLGLHRSPAYRLLRRHGIRLAPFKKGAPRRAEHDESAASAQPAA